MIKTDVLIIGAGPVGLFTVQQLGLIGLKAEVVDNLDKIGGQCIELYPNKPIYDIPAIPECTGESLTKNLLEQIKPFKTNFHLNERVQEISKEKNNWKIVTSKNKIFIAPNIIIAGGVGSFEPRKFSIEEAVKFENALEYSEPEPLPFSARHWLGAALYSNGQYQEAEQVYKDELQHHPHNGWSLYGLQQSLAAQGLNDEDINQDLKESWARSNLWITSSRF